MKILAIGNSFSEDATYYIKKLADSARVNVTVVNLFIGGCSLETHSNNIKNDSASYRYELNGEYTDRRVSVKEALCEEKWDIVTVQQVSYLAGVYESYDVHFKTVLACIKQYAPQAKIYFHETWAYEFDSTHWAFERFNYNQKEMVSVIENVVPRICKENGNLPIIPSGRIIKELRQLPIFDVENGGQRLCRDGFHMHLVYGRYILGLVWFVTLLNGDVEDVTFLPTEKDIINGYDTKNFECDLSKIQAIKSAVKDFFQKNYGEK